MRAIPPELQSLHSVVAAVLDADGVLLESNAGFRRVFGAGPDRRIGARVAGCFSMPGYRELAASGALPDGEVYRGTMRFLDADGGIVQLRGKAWRSGFGLCVLAEVEVVAAGIEARASETQAVARAEREARPAEAGMLDSLTGTGNRAWLDQALAAETADARADGLPLCALLAGIDRHGAIAEKHGGRGGDIALARCGFLLRLLTRPGDTTARYGAETFAVLLPRTNIAQAASAAERIRRAFESDIVEPLDEPLYASFGIAEYRAGEDGAAFLLRAAGTLARAHGAGGNRVLANLGD